MSPPHCLLLPQPPASAVLPRKTCCPLALYTRQLGWPLCRACHRTDKYCFPACSERLSALPHPLKQCQAGCLPNWWAAPRSAADEIVIYSLLFVFFFRSARIKSSSHAGQRTAGLEARRGVIRDAPWKTRGWLKGGYRNGRTCSASFRR